MSKSRIYIHGGLYYVNKKGACKENRRLALKHHRKDEELFPLVLDGPGSHLDSVYLNAMCKMRELQDKKKSN